MIEIKLNKAKNLRDLGGTPCGAGAIKQGVLMRGAVLNKLNEADKSALRDRFGVRTVIDLRTDQEISEKPDVKIDGVKLYHIPILSAATMGISHERTNDMPRGLDRVRDMQELYREMISGEYSSGQIGKALRLIIKSAENGGVLWHCTVGKDRCGIITALVLYILGADMELIYDDYLRTNEFSRGKSNVCYSIARVISDRETAQRVRGIFSAEREFLAAAFDEMEKLGGSVFGYLEKMCGIEQRHILQLKQLAIV